MNFLLLFVSLLGFAHLRLCRISRILWWWIVV